MQRLFRHFVAALLTALPSSCAWSQNPAYKFPEQIDSFVQNSDLPYRFQLAATDYSFIGAYALALATRDRELPRGSGDPSDERKEVLAKYKPADAMAYIRKRLGAEQMVMVNEAHHQPRHRAFMELLLPELKKAGFTCLGIEALDPKDTLLQQRGYPVLASGYYTAEPGFGNLIRKAIALGFTIFPYEGSNEAQAKGANREELQANNISAFMNAHPGQKVAIYCGYDHAIEDSTHNFMVLPMAGRLKQRTGIDPFTIDQVQLTESSTGAYGNTYRKLITVNYDAVLLDNNGRPFNKAKNNAVTFDCNVYHPNTTFQHGRPDWLVGIEKQFVPVQDEIYINYPCLVKAYVATEPRDQAVPADVIVIDNKAEDIQLVLEGDRAYDIVVSNQAGQQQLIRLLVRR